MSAEPDEKVVRICQRLLDDALAGQLRGIAIVTLQAEYDEKSICTGWDVAADAEDIHRLLGGAFHLCRRIDSMIEQ